MRALELNSIMLTRLSWRTRTVNLLTHRHAITRAWVVMYPCTFKFNVWQLNTWLSDRNIHKHFFMKTLMHTNTSSKTTPSLKTSLIKQCYTWYACLNVLLILPQCAADTASMCWYCYSDMYALYYMLNVPCLTSIYFTTVSRWNHAVAKSRPLKTKQIQHFIQHFENHLNIISS
jgi:hypothetical protein